MHFYFLSIRTTKRKTKLLKHSLVSLTPFLHKQNDNQKGTIGVEWGGGGLFGLYETLLTLQNTEEIRSRESKKSKGYISFSYVVTGLSHPLLKKYGRDF